MKASSEMSTVDLSQIENRSKNGSVGAEADKIGNFSKPLPILNGNLFSGKRRMSWLNGLVRFTSFVIPDIDDLSNTMSRLSSR